MASEIGAAAGSVPEKNYFGQWLRATRKARGYTGEALAFKIGDGMTQGRISSYERGMKKPHRETAVQIATALGADPQDALHALMADTPGLPPPTDDADRALLSKWHELPPESQALVSALVEQLAARHR